MKAAAVKTAANSSASASNGLGATSTSASSSRPSGDAKWIELLPADWKCAPTAAARRLHRWRCCAHLCRRDRRCCRRRRSVAAAAATATGAAIYLPPVLLPRLIPLLIPRLLACQCLLLLLLARRLGMIIGPTGSGKTRAIEQLRAASLINAAEAPTTWPEDRAIVSAISASPLVRQATKGEEGEEGAAPTEETCARDAIERLSSVGLNTLPTWLKPHSALSNGQRARAALAYGLVSGGAVDDVRSQPPLHHTTHPRHSR